MAVVFEVIKTTVSSFIHLNNPKSSTPNFRVGTVMVDTVEPIH